MSTDGSAGPEAMREIITRDGLRYFVDPTDGRAQALSTSAGEFNAPSVRIFQALLARQRWDLILDIGANYGEMIAAIPPIFSGKVIAFEPNLHLHPFLRRTAESNGIAVEIRKEAVGRKDGAASFRIDRAWSGMSSLVDNASARDYPVETAEHHTIVDVEVRTLDSLFRRTPGTTALIKIDVEGAEIDVLTGGSEFLHGLDHCAIQIETLRLSPSDLAMLAARWKMYFFSHSRLNPVRLTGGDRRLAELYLASGRFYKNDVVLLPARDDTPLSM